MTNDSVLRVTNDDELHRFQETRQRCSPLSNKRVKPRPSRTAKTHTPNALAPSHP